MPLRHGIPAPAKIGNTIVQLFCIYAPDLMGPLASGEIVWSLRHTDEQEFGVGK
jgi:hypothetical protein